VIFLTGGTGFLGKEILGRILLSRPTEKVCLLVRPRGKQQAEDRVKKILSDIFGSEYSSRFFDRIEIVEGDLLLNNFGLGDSQFKALASNVSEIYHSAASTDLAPKLDFARESNVGGTLRTLNLAEVAAKLQGSATRFHHISTAYTAGATDSVVLPGELSLDRGFRNNYERSKAEAELEVLSSSDMVHTTIYRPSVIVGDSVTGETSAFNVIYIPARFLAKGLFQAIPATPHAPFDIVPVDYVADGIVALSSKEETIGNAYHLCAGVGRESTPLEILEVIIRTFNAHRKKGLSRLPTPRLIPLEISDLTQKSFMIALDGLKHIEKIFVERLGLFKQVFPYIPYMTANPRFDMSETENLLHGSVGPAPLFSSYAERVFSYCVETNWGKNPWANPSDFNRWFARTGGELSY
jgi:thioester reductase-like protein